MSVAFSVSYWGEMGQKEHKRDKNNPLREVRVGDFRGKEARLGAKIETKMAR